MNKNLYALGIDIGGTNTKVGVFSLQGELKTYFKTPTLKNINPEQFIHGLAGQISQSLNVLDQNYQLIGVGAGAPMANYFTGQIDHAPNLGWKNVALKALIEKEFNCPAVIENDANLAAFGEARWGSGKELQDFILITLGTGVGTGLILGGQLYRGHNGLGAEGGHLLIPHTKQRACTCGGLNHLESYLSAAGIKSTMQEMGVSEWSLEDLSLNFHQNHPIGTKIIHQLAEELASGLISMAVLIGPQSIIIGGGVSMLGPSFNQILKEKVNQRIHFSLKDKIEIISASLSAEKGAIYGGAALIIHETMT